MDLGIDTEKFLKIRKLLIMAKNVGIYKTNSGVADEKHDSNKYWPYVKSSYMLVI